jgi:hypothetical protein
VPLGDFHVEEVVAKVLDVLKVLLEDSLQLNEVLSNLRALGASKDRHLDLGALSCELQLTLTDFFKILATLDECLILSEDSLISIKRPSLANGVLFNHALHLEADVLPFLAASDTLIKVTHALLDITFEHVVLIDLGAASLDDLVRDLSEETLHTLLSVVVFGELPDDTDAVENLREELRDVLRLRVLNFAARLSKGVEELQVVVGFLVAFLNLFLKLLEAWEVRTTSCLEDCNDAVKLGLLKLDIKDVEVGSATSPMLDLIQGTGGLSTVLRVLV